MNKRVDISAGLEQSAFWMPYTANRQFKKSPRLLARAEGMHYWTPEGREIWALKIGTGDTSAKPGIVITGCHHAREWMSMEAPLYLAGKLLDDILAAVDLTRQQIYLTNIVKCRAAVEEGGRLRNRQPKTVEIRACNPYLQGQIEAVGGPAAKTIIDKDFRITKDRGKWHEIDGIKTMATFHPAYVLRQRGDDLNNTKRLVWKDIKAVYAEYQKAMEERGQDG